MFLRVKRYILLFALIGCLHPKLPPRFEEEGHDGVMMLWLASSFLLPSRPTPFKRRLSFPQHQKNCWITSSRESSRKQLPSCTRCRTTITNLAAGSSKNSKTTTTLDDSGDFVEAQDLEALQALFTKYCDSDGLMTKVSAMQIPAIAELMAEGDLLVEEFNDIWEKAPKFPDVEASEDDGERIDVDSFVQIYRDIDDLFEDEEVDYDKNNNKSGSSTTSSAGQEQEQEQAQGGSGQTVVVESDNSARGDGNTATTSSVTSAVAVDNEEDDDDDDDNDGDETMEAELETIFESICDKNNLISKETLRAWDEVSKLLEDGLLGDDEFEDLWDKTKKSPAGSSSGEQLDVDGFLSFNVALDALFDFEDDEDMEAEDMEVVNDDVDQAAQPEPPSSKAMVDGDDLSPSALFSALKEASSGFVGREDLLRWNELQEMLRDGDLLQSELDEMFRKAAQDRNRLDEAGFRSLYQAIDDLFEDDNDDEGDDREETAQKTEAGSLKQELLYALEDLDDPDLLPCGLESTEPEQRRILRIVTELEKQPSNLVRARNGAIDMTDLTGTWELLYSSSSAMKFNKGLSGLGGSFPNGKFGGLKQKLQASKFMADVEYEERIDVNPSSASFDVKVTGGWDLGTSVSIFTGEPSIVMTVEPDRVEYGPTSTRADHWKSLGPMNMLDVSYLDEDLRIMRGNTAVDTIFVFRRSTSE